MSEAKQPVLEVRNLSVTLPKGADREFAVDKVNFTVNPGEIVCLVGESGSGKSVIFQEPMTALNPVMTCGDQIDEVLSTHTRLDAGERRAKILGILDRVK